MTVGDVPTVADSLHQCHDGTLSVRSQAAPQPQGDCHCFKEEPPEQSQHSFPTGPWAAADSSWCPQDWKTGSLPELSPTP